MEGWSFEGFGSLCAAVRAAVPLLAAAPQPGARPPQTGRQQTKAPRARGVRTVLAATAFTAAALGAGPAAAAGPAGDPATSADYRPQLWINPGIRSFHFDRDKDLRENNYGLGFEAAVTPEHVLTAGRYRNSNDRMSSYAAYTWRPLQWGALRLGVMLAAFDGYPNMRDGGWFAAVLPAASLEYGRFGVNFTIVPTYQDKLNGAFAVQLKFRIW